MWKKIKVYDNTVLTCLGRKENIQSEMYKQYETNTQT